MNGQTGVGVTHTRKPVHGKKRQKEKQAHTLSLSHTSWIKVVEALQRMDRVVLAQQLQRKYIYPLSRGETGLIWLIGSDKVEWEGGEWELQL